MQIPGSQNRKKALGGIRRVLRHGGYFIFTTHDRHFVSSFASFWREQETMWKDGKQDPRLIEYGDIIVESKEENPIYVHIPTPEEIRALLDDVGFSVVETAMRSELIDEPENIKNYSCDCRFWVVH
jgi:hypothetical protein